RHQSNQKSSKSVQRSSDCSLFQEKDWASFVEMSYLMEDLKIRDVVLAILVLLMHSQVLSFPPERSVCYLEICLQHLLASRQTMLDVVQYLYRHRTQQ